MDQTPTSAICRQPMNCRTVWSVSCLGLLVCLWTLLSGDEFEIGEFPHATLSHGGIQLVVYLPDPDRGINRGTRFDRSGFVARVTYQGHNWFGKWYDKHDPQRHDNVMGTAGEFGMGTNGMPAPLGFGAASVGDPIVKIGVGIIRKKAAAYGFTDSHDVIQSGNWTEQRGDSWIACQQKLNGLNGFGYQYKKRISIGNDPPGFRVDYELENTGTRSINQTYYAHNFVQIDDRPIGPDYRFVFAKPLTADRDTNGMVSISGNVLNFSRRLKRGESVYTQFREHDLPTSANGVLVEHLTSGAAIRITGSAALSRYHFWATDRVACPEPFVSIHVEPGKTFRWNDQYELIVKPKPHSSSYVPANTTNARPVAELEKVQRTTLDRERDHSDQVEFKVPAMWEYTAPLISPEKRQLDPSLAQKDPTVVFHDGRWHVFMTVKLPGRSAIEYCSFQDWHEANQSARTILTISDSDYYCAPQVFFFRPHNKWYLIYQMGVPGRNKMWVAYSTTSDISDPETWTTARPILDGGPNDPRVVGGLDYWVICDDERAYLFLTSLNGKMWRLHTDIDRFPNGFADCKLAMEAKVFEASHTYRLKGTNRYLTIIEENGRRYFKAYLANRLDGPWTPIADTADRPFAGWNNIRPAKGIASWTDNVSHGELIRDGCDQTLTIDPNNLRFVFQGMLDRAKSKTGYGQFSWRIGILTPVPTNEPNGNDRR